jgi:hypothetical protein
LGKFNGINQNILLKKDGILAIIKNNKISEIIMIIINNMVDKIINKINNNNKLLEIIGKEDSQDNRIIVIMKIISLLIKLIRLIKEIIRIHLMKKVILYLNF